MNITETTEKSWSMFDSSDGSPSLKSLQDAFEEVDFYSNPESENGDRNASYEVIDDNPEENFIREANVNLDNVNEPEKRFVEQPMETTERPNDLKREDLNRFIRTTAETLLDSTEKQQEIQNFEGLLRKFDKWFLEKKERRYLQARGYVRKSEVKSEEIPSFKFLVHNSSLNVFMFPFSDVYVNIVTNKQSHKNKIQSLFAEFLRETEPQGVTQEYDFKSRKSNNRKLIFRFSPTGTKFQISVGLDFRVRINHFIKLCTNIDKTFLILGAFLSNWAHKKDILNEKYMNPYALHFMIVYFLMTKDPAILPKFDESDLEKMNFSTKILSSSQTRKPVPTLLAEKDESNSSLTPKKDQSISSLTPKREQVSEHLEEEFTLKESLVDLVGQFFYFFAYEVPKLRKSLSIRKGMPIKGSRLVIGYSIEDPFNPQYDLCRNLNDTRCKGFQNVQREFDRAYQLVAQGKIEKLCKEGK